MKKVFAPLIILLFISSIGITVVHAVSSGTSTGSTGATSCSSIDSTNYIDCGCGTPSAPAACADYNGTPTSNDTNTSTPVIVAPQNTTPANTSSQATAPTNNSCSPITSSNYSTCCTGVDTSTPTGQACYQYYYSSGTSSGDASCSTIALDNYDQCCTGVDLNTTTGQNCTNYYYTSGLSTVPQQVGGGGGAQSTNPFNTAAGNTGLNSGSGGTPASNSSQAVAACSAIQFNTLLSFAVWAKCIIGAVVIPGIFTLAFVVFLWGVLKFIRASEDKDKEEGKKFIYMGLIGLFVMVSVWGIIAIVTTTFGITPSVPTLQTDYLNNPNGTTTPSQ